MCALLAQSIKQFRTASPSARTICKYPFWAHPSAGQQANFSLWNSFANSTDFIARSSVVHWSTSHLIEFHEWSHLPWFAEIALITIAARICVTFPLTISQRKILYRLGKVRPELEGVAERMKAALSQEGYFLNHNQPKMERRYRHMVRKEMRRVLERENVHPYKIFLVPLFQLPIGFVLSHSYRNLARCYPDPTDPLAITAFEQLQHEGLFWFHDLTVPDPTGILPLAAALVNLTIIQVLVIHRRRITQKEDSFWIKALTNVSRGVSLLLIPFGLSMPASMPFYWLVSSSMGLLQNLLLINPKVEKALKIEITTTKNKDKENANVINKK